MIRVLHRNPTILTAPGRAFRSAERLIMTILTVLAIHALAAPLPAFACTTCDTNNKCHSGDEQGGYLCRVVEIHCGFLSQIFGANCRSNTCETTVPCDNRKPAQGAPRSEADLQDARCSRPGPNTQEAPPALSTAE